MSMWDMIYAFGVWGLGFGVSFVVGIAFGSATLRMTTKERRQQHETIVGLLEKKNVILEEMLQNWEGK